MTVASISRTSASGLPPTMRSAQAAIQLPEVQDMLRRLSAFQLGIFMPHQHDEATGEFLTLPVDVMQVESGLAVSFQRLDVIASQSASFLPVAWLWRAGAPTVAAACEMAEAEVGQAIKHKMPGDD
ncbi:MAG: hypothetical protein V4639_19130 [Pseudomonadota bacterium]|jgi:hypothetical protein